MAYSHPHKKAIEKLNVQILDVRTAGEYQSGDIQNAFQANWNDAKEFKERTQHLDKAKTVFVYCQAGARSAAAQSFLMEQGYTVVNLEGGLSSWKMNQLPVEGNANAVQMRVVDFDKVIAENKMVLVDIGASWCPPCRKMQPIVEQIKKEHEETIKILDKEISKQQIDYAASDVLHLHKIKIKLDEMLKRENRYEDFQQCLGFLPTRAKLDIEGFTADIFAH